MGVSILPRLPAMVMRVTVRQRDPVRPTASRRKMPKETKVMRATSLVMSILEKKQRATSVTTTPRAV